MGTGSASMVYSYQSKKGTIETDITALSTVVARIFLLIHR